MSMPAPAQALTPGLDFSNVSYGRLTDKKFAAQVKVARDIIEEKLPLLEELKSVFSVTLAEGDFEEPPIWVDARSNPVKIVESAPVEEPSPAFEITLSPVQIESLYTGFGEEPQTVVFLGSKHKGDASQAIQFADLLSPNPSVAPTPKKDLNLDELPQPTEDIDQVRHDIKKWGYGYARISFGSLRMMKNALTPEQVAILKNAVQEQAAGERNAGLATFDGGPTKPNQRVWNLYNKGDEFADLMNHPLVDAIVAWYLGEDPLLWSYNANIARPGGYPQVLHWDSGVMGTGRAKPVALNISWLLVDMTEKNGGTRIFPGSHIGNTRPRNIFSTDGSIAAEAPAGTALCFEGRIWHGTGPNTEVGGERPVILSLFTNKGIRPKENCLISLDWEVEDRLSERHKSLTQYRTAMAGVGGWGGESRKGIIVRRPRGDEHKQVGKLRAPHDPDELAKMMLNGTHADNAASAAREVANIDSFKK